ncbi:MAG TPA: metal-dependent hydrolase [Sedimentisphaerales bacterium]|nr:metal-dependent hydrolase [Sedimentisphaerales bacterium]
MPFTPYHFGPSGFLGLALRRWIDLPVFLLANVVVDIEVLIFRNYPVHRYAHTLLIGAAVGAVWGVAAYPLRNYFKSIMEAFGLPYKTGFFKMLLSGVLGVWLHVLIDAVYHYDVRPLWPFWRRSLHSIIRSYLGYPRHEVIRGYVIGVCVAFFIAAIVLYVLQVRASIRKSRSAHFRQSVRRPR